MAFVESAIFPSKYRYLDDISIRRIKQSHYRLCKTFMMLDQNQLIIGISVLMSFFVGYRYALKSIGKGISNPMGSSDIILAHHFFLFLFLINYTDDDEIDTLSKTVKSTKNSTAPRGEYKMVLVVRNDLKMGKGKIGAQW